MMAVTFQSKSNTPITLLDEDAQRLLKIIGHSGSVPSALRAEDIPAALDKLQQAVEREEVESVGQEKGDENLVQLKNRVTPIMGLLNAALSDDEIVMWR